MGRSEGADAGVRDQTRLHLLELVGPVLPPRRHELVRALGPRAAENLGVILLEHLLRLRLARLAQRGLVVANSLAFGSWKSCHRGLLGVTLDSWRGLVLPDEYGLLLHGLLV